jgi:hypothetical protein
MRSLLLNCITLGSTISLVYARGGSSAVGTKWDLRKLDNLITFGDRFVQFTSTGTVF